MSSEQIARSMQARMPWPVGQKVLRELQIERGQGWAQTVEKLKVLADDEKLEALTEALREHLQCGEKSSRFYPVGRASIDACLGAKQSIGVPQSAFKEVYPCTVPEDKLAGLSKTPVLTAIEETEDAVCFLFSSVRHVVVREPLGPEDFPGHAGDELFENFDEIIGLKNKRLQAVDAVNIPKTPGLADVRIDFHSGTTMEAAEIAHLIIKKAINEVIGHDVLGEPLNVFPLIDRMYFDATEGSVVEIGFGTSTASLKQEKMRRRGLCLRKEAYHVGGKASLTTPIEPFRVSIVWALPLSDGRISTPELSLNSNSRVAGSASPLMNSVLIRKCMGVEDYTFVRSRIEHHLSAAAIS